MIILIATSFVKSKIDRLRMEIEIEKNIKNRELLEERILVLEELLSETICKNVFEDVDI